ncbi:MAG: hypothetical protein ACKO2K_03945 [Alphaproteobacteria bacterium]
MTLTHRKTTRKATGAMAVAVVAALSASTAHAVVLPSQFSCQQSVSKAGRAYLASVLKLRTGCRAAELAGTAGACSAAAPQKSLADAAAKHDAKLARTCGAIPADALVAPRPAGLSLAPLDALGGSLRTSYDRIARALAEDL